AAPASASCVFPTSWTTSRPTAGGSPSTSTSASTATRSTSASPHAGTRVAIKETGYCDEGGQSDAVILAGSRLLWEDGWSANTYSDYSVFTLDTLETRDGKHAADGRFRHAVGAGEDDSRSAGRVEVRGLRERA